MKSTKTHLIDFSVIVFGVLLALRINGCSENMMTEATLTGHLILLNEDISADRERLEKEISDDSITLNRLALIRDKIAGKNYKGIDPLMRHLTARSSFTLNDTGFRMIMQSGNSKLVDTFILSQLTALFGVALTELRSSRDADLENCRLATAFLTEHDWHLSKEIQKSKSRVRHELQQIVTGRLTTLNTHLQQKLNLRQKMFVANMVIAESMMD